MTLCFVALGWAIRQGLRPLAELGEAMASVERGQLASRLGAQNLQEVNDLVARFNTMAAALEQEQKTVRELMTELLRVQDREREHIAREIGRASCRGRGPGSAVVGPDGSKVAFTTPDPGCARGW